ncbi:S1 family peptidase [Acetobacter fabarum]|uniref:Serine protease n=1 Tax=Acetobacter fabarum TaxID=483199 RepID=A0A269XUC1_9PROT|nr:serine protease [Acetobacter fabarum]PAK76769.1 hypothetical protein B8X00_13220 [Acetobacter fabarum]PEN21735.1 serine protease [Acetobacter fabarum]
MDINWKKSAKITYAIAGMSWSLLAFSYASIEHDTSQVTHILHVLSTNATYNRGQPTPEDHREPSSLSWDEVKGRIKRSVVAVATPVPNDEMERQKHNLLALVTVNWTVPLALEWLQHKVFMLEHHGARRYTAGLATGFVYGDGHKIITAAHAVSDATSPNVFVFVPSESGHDFLQYPARILNRDDRRDVALLEVQDWQGVPLPISPYRVASGSEIMSVRMKGIVQSEYGYLIAHAKPYRDMTALNSPKEEWLTTDAPYRGGFSGGPVLNKRGEVLGVVSGGSDHEGSATPIDRLTY